MDGILLKDPDIKPDKKVLEKALGKSWKAYDEMMRLITSPEFSLKPEWRYYNDGKAWLCKVCSGKKTIFWLSVREGEFFSTVFYFTEKTGAGIASLNIDERLKLDFKSVKSIGKLIPLGMNITMSDQLPDLLTIARYKMGR
jgi:hypothetical protein